MYSGLFRGQAHPPPLRRVAFRINETGAGFPTQRQIHHLEDKDIRPFAQPDRTDGIQGGQGVPAAVLVDLLAIEINLGQVIAA